MTSLRACLLNCSLKGGSAPSSTDKLLGEVAAQLRAHGVDVGAPIRVVDRDVKPGVTSDEGTGDAWPAIRQEVLASQVLVLGTPIWLGQPSSIAKRVLERMDAFLGETDDAGRMVSYGRVAIVAVVGNEDGAHHVSAELFQGLSDVGFTIPANGVTYWVGEAMQSTDYNDLPATPEKTSTATASAVRNAVHLARLLAADQYPGDDRR
jgi:multimeric flavodoxin WrbA